MLTRLIQRMNGVSEDRIEYEYEYRDAEYEYDPTAETGIWPLLSSEQTDSVPYFFLFSWQALRFQASEGFDPGGLRLARRNSNGGTRRTAVVHSVSAPNRYHGSALARSVRRWAAKTAASRKAMVRLLGGSRRAQEIHPFPRIRQFKSTVHSTSRVSSCR
jgi:hypothetical protein